MPLTEPAGAFDIQQGASRRYLGKIDGECFLGRSTLSGCVTEVAEACFLEAVSSRAAKPILFVPIGVAMKATRA